MHDEPPAPATPHLYRFALTCGDHSPRHVRRILRAYLRLWELPHLTDPAELATSELLSNVIRHVPDRWCRVTLLRQATGIRIEVTDRHPVLPEPRTPALWDESGRGLALLAQLADAWGVTPLPGGGGKTVWLRLKA
ncbi:ATP-binding protein [Streptomyces sp. 6N223]|uniref:ATP-binding protein n=1 Tax=Streptomyces sp. 6N223 TaxID=3457412 RepID=UPI003FD2005E